jgi:oligopeptidase B
MGFSYESAKQLTFQEPTYSLSRTAWYEFDSDVLRVHYQSLVRPPTHIDVNMNDMSQTVRKVDEVRGGKFDPANYR